MLDKFFERWAARKNPRFRVFVEAKEAYESFAQELQVRFEEMGAADYRRAREDSRLEQAAEKFIAALEMSEREEALADAAVAKYQLGLVRHIRGELDEARQLMHAALEVLGNLPHHRSGDLSACLYHLGIIALKEGRLREAVRDLRRSRQMDEANADLGGMQLCDFALAACAAAGADIEADIPLQADEAGSWDTPENTAAPPFEEDGTAEFKIKPGPIRFDRRELIWLASYSVPPNDALMAYLNSLGDDFGRPVSVSRVAFGSPDPGQRHLPHPESDQHLCATILVLERVGLHDRAFQELAFACMRRVVSVPDFRLLVYLHDLTIDELRDLSDRELLVASLFDTTQIAELPSVEQLRRTLVPYIRRVERLQAAAWWRESRLKLAGVCGKLATILLIAAASIALLGFPAWLLKSKLIWLGPHAPKLASLVLGVLAFPLQAPLIFLLLRGMRATAIAARDNASLRRWVIIGAVIMLGANHFHHALAGPNSWFFLGLVLGVLLDSIRRAGRQARRQLIDLEALNATDPAFADPQETVLRGDPLNPFSCPLLPRLAAKTFISYTRSSAKGSRFAAALFRHMKEARAAPFLDRASIPPGASWRRDLNYHLGQCDTFLSILDEKSVQRKWVAAELLAAIEARRLTGTPEIVILADPAIQRPSQSMLPVFRGVVAASALPPIPGRPLILQLNAATLSSAAWGLAPGRFMPASVFTRVTALPIMYAMSLMAWVGGLGILAGFILGFLAMLEKMANFPLASGLADRGWLDPVMLLTAFWLGFTARATIAWGYEREHGGEMGVATPTIATCGLVYAAFVLVPSVSILGACWSVALLVAGWMMVASVMRLGVRERKVPGE